jgi:hypothetical protein
MLIKATNIKARWLEKRIKEERHRRGAPGLLLLGPPLLRNRSSAPEQSDRAFGLAREISLTMKARYGFAG